MTTGQQIVDLAMTQTGKRYVFGVENDSRTVATATAWDCSELVQIVCRELGVAPVMPDGAYWQWRHCRNNNTFIPIDQARRTPGALLFVGPGTEGGKTGRDAIWHVAISRGDGTTIEAKSTKDGTGSWPIANRFTFAALIPGVDHANAGTPPPYVPPNETATPTPTLDSILKEDDVMLQLFQTPDGQHWRVQGVHRVRISAATCWLLAAQNNSQNPGSQIHLQILDEEAQGYLFDGTRELVNGGTDPGLAAPNFPSVLTGTITIPLTANA